MLTLNIHTLLTKINTCLKFYLALLLISKFDIHKHYVIFFSFMLTAYADSIYIDIHKHYVVLLKKKQFRVSNDKQKNIMGSSSFRNNKKKIGCH
jgi:hypothetical protein